MEVTYRAEPNFVTVCVILARACTALVSFSVLMVSRGRRKRINHAGPFKIVSLVLTPQLLKTLNATQLLRSYVGQMKTVVRDAQPRCPATANGLREGRDPRFGGGFLCLGYAVYLGLDQRSQQNGSRTRFQSAVG